MEAKFKVGDKVVVCQELNTVIEKVQPIENGDWLYWFKDENGVLKCENWHAIELPDREEIKETADLYEEFEGCPMWGDCKWASKHFSDGVQWGLGKVRNPYPQTIKFKDEQK